MGLLRTLLALSVVIVHAPPYKFSSALSVNAVPLFYVISGYLISYILTEGHTYSNFVRFYFNRMLRLYPLYYFVMIMCALAYLWEPYFWQNFAGLPGYVKAYLMIVNVTILGQEWVYLLAVQGNALAITTDIRASDFPIWQFLVNPPSWTLSVELSFYLIAPFVLQRPAWIIGLFLSSLLARAVAVMLGCSMILAAGYTFFPFELSMFLMGALSHRYLLPIARSVVAGMAAFRPDTLITVASLILFSGFLLVSNSDVEGWIFEQRVRYVTGLSVFRLGVATILCVTLPFMFIFQTRTRWDAIVGEWSYPIYICHHLVIIVLYTWSWKHAPALTDGWSLHLTMIGGSIILAVMLNRFVTRRIEPVRRWIRQPRAPSGADQQRTR